MKSIRTWVLAATAACAVACAVSVGEAQLMGPTRAVARPVLTNSVRQANKSTLLVKTEERGTLRQVVMATVITADGFVLTKGSEVLNLPKILVAVRTGSLTRNYEAKIVGWSQPLDLAMLKIDASGLIPVKFADTRPPEEVPMIAAPAAPPPATGPTTGRGRRGEGRGGAGGGGRGAGAGRARGPVVIPKAADPPAPPEGAVAVDVGEWVAVASAVGSMGTEITDEPVAVGVISTRRRSVAGANGFLGVMMAETGDATGARITQVVPESAAEKAGLKNDDVVTAVNGTPVKTMLELQTEIRKSRPGDLITLSVTRGTESMSVRAALGVNPDLIDDDVRLLSGMVSKRAGDFPAVFQHDTLLQPKECGGPLVDLEGNVIGINIARAGRTESFALPADVIVPLLEPLKSGKLAPVNANVPTTEPAK